MAREIYISLCRNKHRGMRLSRGWSYRMFYSAILGLILITTLAMYPMPLYNGSATAGAGVSKLSTSSITLATTATGSSVSLTPGAGFKLSNTSDTAGFNVTTDNFTGYSIKLTAADDNQTLVNADNSSYTISSISSPVIQTNFISTNTSLMNRWGIKPNKYYDATSSTTITNTTTILPAPTSTGIMLDVTSAANSTANNYSIALGAMVDGTKPAGTYNRVTTLQVTPNPIIYLVNYADNSGDSTVANMPSAASSGSVTTANITLDSTVPTRTGYLFDGWCLGTVTDNGTTCTGTKFAAGASFGIDQTVDNTNLTVYATWAINAYTITYGTVTGIASVSLNGGTACTIALTSGGCTKTLTYGQTYNLVATPSTGYSFTSWSAGSYGTIANIGATGASTTYTVGAGNSTITPTSTVNQYTCTKQYRLQNADGTWGSYTTETTEQVNYGETCSYSKSVTNYTGVSGTNSQAGTASGTMTENGLTLQVSLYRNTFSVTLTKGTGISSVSVTGTGVKSGSGTASAVVYYGGNVTIGATMTSGYVWVNWTGSATYTTRSQSISNVTSNRSFTANGSACSISTNKTYTFGYTGAAQTFTTPCYGKYKVELWGAQGGNSSSDSSILGAKGAYTAGTILLNKSISMYVYVGSGAANNTTANGTVFNGGTGSSSGWNGGGATDIRVTSGAWNDAASIRSRIMVAGGGGTTNSGVLTKAGAGGGLTGYNGGGSSSGGTQISVGNGDGYSTSYFGIANGGCTGGNGWYPAGGATCAYGSGGGSSYISGHTGSVAVTSTSSSTPKSGCTTGTTSNACSITPYINAATNAGYTFTSTLMIDGLGYKWTNTKGSRQQMPNPSGGNYASGVGRTGHGYARITYLGSE